MKQDGSIELFQYWNRLRNGRAAPKRTEVEPADIKRLLADTFILEKDVRGDAVFRLAGTRLCATYGRELKGFAFLSFWAQKDQALVARLANGAFLAKTVVVITFDGVSRTGRDNPFELILLPLDGGQEHPRTLGSVMAEIKPFWLGADPIVENRVTSVRVVDPEREPMFLKNRPSVPVPAMVPSDEALQPRWKQPATGRRIRHLVVFDGGRGGD
jgi:hypothetical protein